ncbi:TetR family transcriptional regulator [Nocardia sp. NPDC003345]
MAGVTIRAVAAESGLPFSTAAVYFGSKEQLVAELFCRTLASRPRPGHVRCRAGRARATPRRPGG